MGRHVESSVGHGKGLANLGAAFATHRLGTRGQRISSALRSRAVAAVAAGVPAGTVCRVCHVSWKQLSRWRAAAELAEGRARTTVPPSPDTDEFRVLSVVEPAPVAGVPGDGEIEIRVGGLLLSIRRAAG